MKLTIQDLQDVFYKAKTDMFFKFQDHSKPVIQKEIEEEGWRQVLKLCEDHFAGGKSGS